MEPFMQCVKEAKMDPFEREVKGANLSAKEANLVVKASQIGTLNNKELIKLFLTFSFLPLCISMYYAYAKFSYG